MIVPDSTSGAMMSRMNARSFLPAQRMALNSITNENTSTATSSNWANGAGTASTESHTPWMSIAMTMSPSPRPARRGCATVPIK